MSPKICLLPVLTLAYFTVIVLCEDVTTIFQLETTADGEWLTAPYFAHQIADGRVFEGHDNIGSWRIHSRNNARGIPLRRGDFGVLNVWAGQPCCETWSRQGWSKLSNDEASRQQPLLELDSLIINKTHRATASIWRLDRERAELVSPPFSADLYQGNVCVSIVARVTSGARLLVAAQHKLVGATRESEPIIGSSRSSWVKKRIVIRIGHTASIKMVRILLTGVQAMNTSSPILVQWAAGCDPSNLEDVATTGNVISRSNITNDMGFRSTEVHSGSASSNATRLIHGVCKNDGIILPGYGAYPECVCRPGFKGRLCDKGCGPNRFGRDCASRCSSDSSSRQCRGMWLCTPDLPCDCGPGFKGPLCDHACEQGKYGIGCRQSCGKCAFGDTCDRHTGWCANGCRGGLLPPFCKEECGRERVAVPLIGYGSLVDERRSPWHAGVYKNSSRIGESTNDTGYKYICGGTLISSNILISSGHCFYDHQTNKLYPTQQFAVALGKRKVEWDADEEFPERVQKREVAVLHVPPEYRGYRDSDGDDIVVVVLATPVEETEFVVPACFDRTGAYEQELQVGTFGRVVGWGYTENNTVSDVLREATVPYFSRVECLRVGPEPFRRYIMSKDRFCAGEPGSFVSKGDSGGGLMFLENSAWYLRGIISTAPSNGRNFAAYTSVSYHRDWIVSIEEDVYFRTELGKSPEARWEQDFDLEEPVISSRAYFPLTPSFAPQLADN